LASKHKSASNPANAPSTDQCGATKRSLPMPSDVVCLICENRGRVATGAGNYEERAKISDPVVAMVRHQDQPDDGNDGVEGDEGGTQPVTITYPRLRVHVNAGENPGRDNETLRLGNIEPCGGG
jgi:hypothetical protein